MKSKMKKSILATLVMFAVIFCVPILYLSWFVNLPEYHVLYVGEGLFIDPAPAGFLLLARIAKYDFHTTAPEFGLLTAEIADNCEPVDRVPTDIDLRTRITHPLSGLDLALGHDSGPEFIGWDDNRLDESGQPTPVFSEGTLDNLVVLNGRVCQSTHELMSRLKRAIRNEIERQNVAGDGARIETVITALARHCWNHFDDCRRRLLPNPATEDIN